jgi:sensor histidine kinase regulating citrate/malate metabolism
VLDVLVANALRHGRGIVTILARDARGALAIDVSDQGSTKGANLIQGSSTGWPMGRDETPGGRRSLGLHLAKALAEGEGGRLLHAWTQDYTRFTLLLPTSPQRSGPEDLSSDCTV